LGKAKASPRGRLEAWMANPGCEKNVASAAFGVSMVDLDGADKTPKIVSPFASSLGNQFEFSLNEVINPLLASSNQSGLSQDLPWPAVARTIKNPTEDDNKNPTVQLERSIEELDSVVDSLGSPMNRVVNGFRIPFTPFDSTLEIDMLVFSPDPKSPSNKINVVIGEVKVYPDLGGYVDDRKISGARRQAGLYYRILTDWLNTDQITQRFPGITFHVHQMGFVVLTSPHSVFEVRDARDWESFSPSLVTNEDLTTQSEIITKNFEKLQSVIDDERSNAKIDRDDFNLLKHINSLDHQFNESCWGRCPLAEACFTKAVEAGDPIVLGARIKNALGNLTVDEAIEFAMESQDENIGGGSDAESGTRSLANEFADFRFTELDKF
jgi:hypothetical protein